MRFSFLCNDLFVVFIILITFQLFPYFILIYFSCRVLTNVDDVGVGVFPPEVGSNEPGARYLELPPIVDEEVRYDMMCCVTLCYVMLCYVISCQVMLCYDICVFI